MPDYPADKCPRDFQVSPCPYCGVMPKMVGGIVVYPRRQDLRHNNFWFCDADSAWVGCHPGTTNPLGTLANAHLRRLRSLVHSKFDPLWKGGRMTRSAAYKVLRHGLGISKNDCHVSKFDEDMCKRAVNFLAEYKMKGSHE